MKLKQFPQDFIVEEITTIPLSQHKKAHSVFIMEKINIDTFDAILLISQKTNIPIREIGYAGLKDKKAITRQYISIPTHCLNDFQNTKNLKLFFAGYHDKKIQIGDLKGNRFQIIIRNIKENELNNIYKQVEIIKTQGVPNYFDSQRFKSVIKKIFIIKYMLEKKYEHAVKFYLTKYQESDSKWIKNDKKKILINWNNFNNISIRNKNFKKVINEYLKTHNWLLAYKKIPANLKLIFIYSYQSYIWNECIKEVLRVCINNKKLFSIRYSIGALVFYSDLSKQETERIPTEFSTVSHNGFYSEFEKKIIEKILTKQGINLSDLSIELLTGNYFKAYKRPIIVKPNDFNISEPMKDEITNTRGRINYSIKTSYFLPKGSYATIIIKRIFYR